MGKPRVGMLGGAAQKRSSEGVTTAPVPDGRLQLIGHGKALEAGIRARMEAFFGADFSGVRVHEGPAAQAMGALAFTLGETLYFAPGLYDPTTRAGVELLGHELTHVVQQRDGRVANPYGRGVAIVQDPALEAEADAMGRRVADEIWHFPGPVPGARVPPRISDPVLARFTPSPATPLQGKTRSRLPCERVIQNMERRLPKYGNFLTERCDGIDSVLVINNTVDEDYEKLAETSISFYDSQGFHVAKKPLSWNDQAREITGNEKQLFGLREKRVLVVVTSHGNVHWLFGHVPDDEDEAVVAFAGALDALQKRLKCILVGVVLDACWSGTEVHETQAAIQVYCPARILSGLIPIPIFGFDGKASSGTISYYDGEHQKQSKYYSEGCLVFKKAKLTSKTGSEEIWHSAEFLQRQNYYGRLFQKRPGSDGYFRSQ